MNEVRHLKYAIVEIEVVGHQKYGVLVRDRVGQKGFIDREELFDSRIAGDVWPPVNAWIRGVVLGYSRDGRLRLSSRPRDLQFAESVDDPAVALGCWQALDNVEVDDAATCEFYALQEARPLLIWALAHGPGALEYEKALRVISAGPDRFADLVESG